ncbi:MAG: hypothetical protein ACRCYU_15350 [Nocardioides sp.]
MAAPAAPARSDSSNEPIYFVHGFNFGVPDPSADCADWWPAITKFRDLGWTGPMNTIGFYTGDTRCGVRIANASRDESIWELGRRLAWGVYWRDSSQGRSVDLVGHSMGGLIIRAAIHGAATNPPGTFESGGWPPYLYVEDVVTFGTPHNGTAIANLCPYLQCRQMRPGSSMLTDFRNRPNPQADGGTDWTLIGTADDDAVPVASATTESPGMGHYVWYYAGYPLEHSQQTTNVSGSYPKKYKNFYDSSWREQSAGASIIVTAKNACHSWRSW